MQDEEGYMVLKVRPKQTQSDDCPFGTGTQGSSPYPQWHLFAIGAGWAWNITLTVAVIMLGAWVFQLKACCEGQCAAALNASKKSETGIVDCTEDSTSLEDFRSHLKSILCETQKGSSAGGAGCKLCPRDWQLRGDKCYWLSKGSKNWTWSRDDCWGKSSQLLVLQSQEELDSIQLIIQGTHSVWTGVRVTLPGGSWTWVNGSRLDPARFPISGPVDGNSCGRLKGSRLYSEICDVEFRWICQRDAAVL